MKKNLPMIVIMALMHLINSTNVLGQEEVYLVTRIESEIFHLNLAKKSEMPKSISDTEIYKLDFKSITPQNKFYTIGISHENNKIMVLSPTGFAFEYSIEEIEEKFTNIAGEFTVYNCRDVNGHWVPITICKYDGGTMKAIIQYTREIFSERHTYEIELL